MGKRLAKLYHQKVLCVKYILNIYLHRCDFFEEDGLVACDNGNFENATCLRRICWETSVGIEFYRLTVFDLFTQVMVIIFVDLIR